MAPTKVRIRERNDVSVCKMVCYFVTILFKTYLQVNDASSGMILPNYWN